MNFSFSAIVSLAPRNHVSFIGSYGRQGPPSRLKMGALETASRSLETPSLGARTRAALLLPKEFGPYRILEQLGQGAMGAVFLAEDTRLRRKVALKAPKFAPDDGPAVLERFLDDICASRRPALPAPALTA